MCKRSAASRDPLLSVFLEKYHLNLLALPRENADVGDLYIHDGKRTGSPGQLAPFLARPFQMPPVTRGEALASVAGTMSSGVKAEVGLGLVEGFLAALGATFPISKAKAHWESKGARNLRFKLDDANRDSVDAGQLGLALIDNTLSQAHPLYAEGNHYYLVTGVARSKSLTVAFEDEQGRSLDLGAGVLGIGNAEAGVSITRGGTGEITFAGAKPLAFGVELYELYVRGDRIRLRLPEAAINVRTAGPEAGAHAARPQPAFIGGDDAEVFLDLAKEG